MSSAPELPLFHLLHMAGQRADTLFAEQNSPVTSWCWPGLHHSTRCAVALERLGIWARGAGFLVRVDRGNFPRT